MKPPKFPKPSDLARFMEGKGQAIVLQGDCIERMKRLPDNSVDAIVTDPPAGISFMNRTWDKPGTLGVSGGRAMPSTTSTRNPSCRRCGGRKRAGAKTKGCTCPQGPDWNDKEYRLRDRAAFILFMTAVMEECYRVLKPGGHALVWALPRTSHWTATAIEDAGFEVRDRVSHMFGSGFPKSMDVSKAIDGQVLFGASVSIALKRVNAERPGKGRVRSSTTSNGNQNWVGGKKHEGKVTRDQPATANGAFWGGWGTALKPAGEDWWLCRKPLSEGTVAKNVLKWGTGALNIDGCRISTADNLNGGAYAKNASDRYDGHENRRFKRGNKGKLGRGNLPGDTRSAKAAGMYAEGSVAGTSFVQPSGRWPANFILSHVEERYVCTHCEAVTSSDDAAVVKRSRRCPSCKTISKRKEPGEVKCRECGTRFEIYAEPPKCACQEGVWDYIPGCRPAGSSVLKGDQRGNPGGKRKSGFVDTGAEKGDGKPNAKVYGNETVDRWVCVDGCPAKLLGEQSGKTSTTGARTPRSQNNVVAGTQWLTGNHKSTEYPGDSGTAARFFYQAKPSSRERHLGCEKLFWKVKKGKYIRVSRKRYLELETKLAKRKAKKLKTSWLLAKGNFHPTLKGTELMRYLCRLITPPGGIVLDPFAGSFSTGVAAMKEGFRCIGIEQDEAHWVIANARRRYQLKSLKSKK